MKARYVILALLIVLGATVAMASQRVMVCEEVTHPT